ncbi:hypothetical protein FK529_05605 [Tsukamurella asaccharolytica]|uniref:Uncharacterized protein n=1 Tax=Tsukamurella asaccharolytica TaxID=2592067 RepID=A0A5C5RDQ5_9ACTN|nr:hypothetical protein [Tsukamurella asaccharolytica]TWS20798.1 hypothetical protein FK529_05605 [Tsukamurella asaccharolytica]
MKLRKLLAYRKHDGDRVAWHIGDVRDPDAGPGGVIEVALEYGDYGIFTTATWTASSYATRHWNSLIASISLWRWGVWIAFRGTEVRRSDEQ